MRNDSERALDTHATISREQLDKNLRVLRHWGQRNAPTDGILGPVGIPNRVDPGLILELMNNIADRHMSKRPRIAPVAGRVYPAEPREHWIFGGGVVDDVFRVPMLYVRFFLARNAIAKRGNSEKMMQIAVNGSSWTAYRTAVDLGYGAESGNYRAPIENLAAVSRFEK